jgi:hypothetical protein
MSGSFTVSFCEVLRHDTHIPNYFKFAGFVRKSVIVQLQKDL